MSVTRHLLPVLLAFGALSATAETFPNKPIRIVAPDTAGGNFDLSARAVGASLSKRLNQPVIVDNRPGGSTTIGASAVAKAPADGHTLLYTGSMHATVRQFVTGTTYDPLDDFTPVSIMATTPIVLAVRAQGGFRSIEDLVQQAKARPDAFTIGTLGPGSSSEIAAQDFMSRTGIRMRTIPYKGAPGASTAVVAGEVDVAVLSPLTSMALIEGGKMRALAISSSSRLDTMPTVPTIAETVAPGYRFDVWFALLAPKGVPGPVMARLFEAVQAYNDEPETKQYLDRMGLQPVRLSYPQTVDYFQRDSLRLVDVAKKMVPTQ